MLGSVKVRTEPGKIGQSSGGYCRIGPGSRSAVVDELVVITVGVDGGVFRRRICVQVIAHVSDFVMCPEGMRLVGNREDGLLDLHVFRDWTTDAPAVFFYIPLKRLRLGIDRVRINRPGQRGCALVVLIAAQRRIPV